MRYWSLFQAIILVLMGSVLSRADVVINEIHYHPEEDAPLEFIELYNPTPSAIRLEGYRFTDGILYQFGRGDRITAGGYYIVASSPNEREWTEVGTRKTGPFLGRLSNSGERLELRNPDGDVIDVVEWSDAAPWSNGADGYGPTLERIDANAPGSDWRNWRSSLNDNGTPAAVNSNAGIIHETVIPAWSISPAQPTSTDDVELTIHLEGAPASRVELRYQPFTTDTSGGARTLVMEEAGNSSTTPGATRYRATLPAQDSQTLVRFKWEITLQDGTSVFWPHQAEPRPFEAYFVYDGEIETVLPLFWMFHSQSVRLPEIRSRHTGGVFKPLDGEVQVRDGAFIFSSRNGSKIRFIKGEEFEQNRTLNILPERPTGSTTSGPQTPFVEQISYEIFRTLGVMVPGAEWYRVIERGHFSQRLLIQQPNEQFLRMNNRAASSDIFKIAYNAPKRIRTWNPIGYEKKTNLDQDDSNLEELVDAIYASNDELAEANVYRLLNYEKVMMYSVGGCLMSNWDGFFNNMFLYYNPPPVNQWEPIPWDCDKTFGYTDGNSMFVEMPLDFPLNGNAARAGRPPGLISQPFHSVQDIHEEYKRRVRHELDHRFSISTVEAMKDHYESLLLEDLGLITGDYNRTARRNDITRSYDTIMRFTRERHDYLRGVLPVSVTDWALMD